MFGLNKPEPKKEKTEEIKKTEPVKEEKIIKEEIKEQGDSNLTMQAEVAEKRNVTQDNKFKNKNANNSNFGRENRNNRNNFNKDNSL